MRPHWRLVLWLAILNLLLAGLMTVAPIVIKAIVDNVIDKKQINLLPGYLALLFGVAAIRAISQYFYGRDRERLGQGAGNEIELRQYPKLGDRIFSQARYSDIRERVAKDGSRMLIITTETTYTNQNGEVLCILRASQIRR